jgi:hypothetical protein
MSPHWAMTSQSTFKFDNQKLEIDLTRCAMKNLSILFTAWLALTAAAVAQMDMPKPGPEHKKLDMFAGSWTLAGNIKPGSMGPGGDMTENEKCEWTEGDFFVVCHTDYKGPMGNGTGVSYMGYSTDDKSYTYREFNSWGEFVDSRGSHDGDSWTWTNDEKMGDKTIKGRFTMKVTSPTTYNFTYEMSQDGKAWTTIMDGKATKK